MWINQFGVLFHVIYVMFGAEKKNTASNSAPKVLMSRQTNPKKTIQNTFFSIGGYLHHINE